MGEDVLKDGLKTYFQKYSFKNTEYKDFIGELAAAAERLNVTAVNLSEWADEWLQSAGCSSFKLIAEEEGGKLKKLSVEQSLYNKENTPLNRLRTQRFQIALLDENMDVVCVINATTSSTNAITEVDDPVAGMPTPAAYILNYEGYGYGKFDYDDKCLKAFEQNLSKVESRDARKLIFCQLLDMIKSQAISGGHLMKIMIKMLAAEPTEENLLFCFVYLPMYINKSIPFEHMDKVKEDIVDTIL